MDISYFADWCTVGAFIFLVIGYFSGFYNWVWGKISEFYQEKKTSKTNLIIHLENTIFPDITNWWCLGKRGDKSGMQVCGNFKATNNSEKEILLTGCYINKFKFRGQVLTYSDFYQNYSAQYSIHSNSTTKIVVNFWIEPSLLNTNDFVSDVIFLDNLGKKHRVQNIKFSYLGK